MMVSQALRIQQSYSMVTYRDLQKQVTKIVVVIASNEIMHGNLKSLDNNFSPSNLVSFPAKK
jgi:small nuclear ribonucleoprotein (snRNP)-like protein